MYMQLYAVFKNDGTQMTPPAWDKASAEYIARRYNKGATAGESYEVRQIANG